METTQETRKKKNSSSGFEPFDSQNDLGIVVPDIADIVAKAEKEKKRLKKKEEEEIKSCGCW